jgi:succinate-semialdehyde dehydrogenase/glutarate-semialdehyde dehydrogenase
VRSLVGEWLTSTTRRVPDDDPERTPGVESRDAFTGAVAERFPTAAAPAVRDAVERARVAQREWAAAAVEHRVRVLDRFRRLAFERRAALAAVISRETGKAPAEALVADVYTALDLVRYYVRHAPTALEPRTSRSATLALWRKRITCTHDPIGVLGVISPWNYPFMLPVGTVAPALAAGNAVVLKPSELTPSTAAMLVELMAQAGLPDGLLQAVQGGRETGEALVHSAVDKVFFTGSVRTGRQVAASCAERLIPCVLELGGSDPALVLDDADVRVAAAGIVWGRFANAGQTCVAPKRVFVCDGAYDPFLEALDRRLEALRLRAPGDQTWDVGPLIRPHAHDALQGVLDDAVAGGARVLVRHGAGTGAVYPPTVVLEAAPGSSVLQEETFGPLLPVVRVRDPDEAVALANDSPFGLSASVWSRSRLRAREVAARLHAGTVAINDVALVAGMAEVAHGGMKASGWGRSHGLEGLRECVRTRTVVDDLLPGLPQPWWFPYAADRYRQLDAYGRLAHGRTLGERLSGIAGTLRLLFRR